MQLLINWVLAFIIANAPPGRPMSFPEAQETEIDATARYESFAKDVAEVVLDEKEKPLFQGDFGRIRTSSVILAIIQHESAFRRDVDLNRGKYARGDGGTSWCSMQIKLGASKDPAKSAYNIVLDDDGGFHYDPTKKDGYGGEDFAKDRKKCLRAGLHILRQSFRACAANPIEYKLNAYASGTCAGGSKESRIRMNLALNWFKANKPSFKDKDVEVLPQPVVTTAVILVPSAATLP